MLGTEEQKPGSSSAADMEDTEQEEESGPEDIDAEALELLGQGKRNLVVGDPPAAVQCFQEACELLASKYGETAEELGDAYYQYGCSLLELASMENGVLGNALQGVPDDSADSDEEGAEKPSGSNVERADKLEAKEREEVIQQVKDALEANCESEESEKEDKEKEGEGEEEDEKEKMDEGGDNKEAEAAEKGEEGKKDEKKEELKGDEKKDEEKKVEEKEDAKKEESPEEKKVEEKDVKKEEEKKVEEKEDAKKEESPEEKDVKKEEKKKDEDKSEKDVEKKDTEKADKDDATKTEKKEKEGKTEKKDDDGDDDEAGPSGEDDQKEDGDDISNFQLAWEMLELSRVIISKKEDEESEMKVSQIHLKLGELGLETEQYAQSIVDFKTCLEIQKKYLDPESRLIAGTHYNLGLACSFAQQFDESIERYRESKQLIEKRLASLEKKVSETEGKGKEKADEKDPIVCAQKEIDELKELLPDIVSKLEDAKEMKLQAGSSDGAGPSSSTSSGFASSSSAFAPSSSTEPVQQIAVRKAGDSVPVTDISNLVRKKRKPEEGDAAAADPKRSRQEENCEKAVVNGSGDSKVANGNGHMANGAMNGDVNGDSKYSPEKPSEIKTKKLAQDGEAPAAMETS